VTPPNIVSMEMSPIPKALIRSCNMHDFFIIYICTGKENNVK
jgi:hypothetical protein